MAYKGALEENESALLIMDYLTRISLSKCGYQFGEVDMIQAKYLTLVHGEFEKLKSEELKKSSKK